MTISTQRLTEDSDCHQAATLIALHLREELGQWVDVDDTLEFLLDRIVYNPDAACYLAYHNDRPVGVALGIWHTDEPQPFYEVRNLYVLPEFRGFCVCKMLLKALLDWSGEWDAPVYITTNGEPRPFYKWLGFEPFRQICGTTLSKIREKLGGKCDGV